MHNAASLTFAEALGSVAPRERVGARTGNLYEYQQSWALCLTLELHTAGSDYCILFDFNDDVLVLDSATRPTSGDFYQVKTKSRSNWTLKGITGRIKGANGLLPSILGKLFDHHLRFPGWVRKLTLVSDAGYRVDMSGGSKSVDRSSIVFSDLSDEVRATIRALLATECGAPVKEDDVLSLTFHTTQLSVGDHSVHAEGRVSDFLAAQRLHGVIPRAFHRSLRTEITRRNNKDRWPSDFEGIRATKGLSRQEFQSMLDDVASLDRHTDVLQSIRDQLIAERSLNFRQRHDLLSAARNFLAKRLDPTNAILRQCELRVKKELGHVLDEVMTSKNPIGKAIAKLREIDAPEWEVVVAQYGDVFLGSIIAVSLYECELS